MLSIGFIIEPETSTSFTHKRSGPSVYTCTAKYMNSPLPHRGYYCDNLILLRGESGDHYLAIGRNYLFHDLRAVPN